MRRTVCILAWLAIFFHPALTRATYGQTSSSARHLPPAPLTSDVSGTSEGRQVLLEFIFYRIKGHITAALVADSLPLDAGKDAKQDGQEVQKGTTALFAKATIKFSRGPQLVPPLRSELTLVADETSWTWNGKNAPPFDDKMVARITTPRVIVLTGETFRIFVGAQEPIQYFEMRPDGSFELKTDYTETGLSITGKVEEGPSQAIVLRDLTIGLRAIEKRVPIEGVRLAVGKPIIRTQECVTSLCPKLDSNYGILANFTGEDGYGCLLIQLRVSKSIQTINATLDEMKKFREATQQTPNRRS